MPNWKNYVREHLPPLGLSGAREAEICEELAQQLEDAYSEAVAAGASEETAAAHAASQIPDWQVLARELREAEQRPAERVAARLDQAAYPVPRLNEKFAENPARRRWGIFMPHLWQDIRYGARTLQKNIGFTVVVVLTLALGIGANATIFTVINAVLLQSLPYPEAGRIVVLHESNLAKGLATFSFSPPNYLDWRAQNHTFERVAAFNEGGYTYTGGDQPEQLNDLEVADGFFEILRARPLIGRTFAADEFQPGKDHEVILTYAFWQRSFGGDWNAVGKTVPLDGTSYTIIGDHARLVFVWGTPRAVLRPTQLSAGIPESTRRPLPGCDCPS